MLDVREEIIRKRKELRLSQAKLAEKCYVSLGTISHLEQGNNPIRLTVCSVIVLKFLDIPWEEIIEGEDQQQSIGIEILKERLDLGVDMKRLSNEAGISVKTLKNIESGRIEPTSKTLKKLTQALKKIRDSQTKSNTVISCRHEKLKEAIRSSGMSPKTLANKAGLHQETIRRILCDETSPNMKTIKKLDEVLSAGLVYGVLQD